MDGRSTKPKREFRAKAPKWGTPYWYLPLMLLAIWMWQSVMVQFAYRTIPYSQFKTYLKRGEVVECAVKEEAIEGKIQPKTLVPAEAAAGTNTPLAGRTDSNTKAFFFRTIRIEDSKLVDELQTAGVKFRG